MNTAELQAQVEQRWPGQAKCRVDATGSVCEIVCARPALAELCGRLFLAWGFGFAGLIVEEGASDWELRYSFYGELPTSWVYVLVNTPLDDGTFPSIVKFVHAADWHEREAEDMFGVLFEGHPRLGDFILHDDAWQEGVEPMRRAFNAQTPVTERRPNADWRPRRIVHEEGAFVMPIGPVFSGLAESVHFQLETVGEDVITSVPRLFYKYRGIEKIAEGRSVGDVLLLAERFSATTAFAHGLAFCHAVETVTRVDLPVRARVLRMFLAELERFRHHIAAIEGICESTALAVAASQMAMLEEELLRVTGTLTGHRYLFGLAIPGGLAKDLDDIACNKTLEQCKDVLRRLNRLESMLRFTSSFLDRLEEVGFIPERNAIAYGLVGPIARASGLARDLRKAQPYSGYADFAFDVPIEREGDGYARLRIFFEEARQSIRLMEQAAAALSAGPICVPIALRAGAALGWVEAPRGAAFHWVRLNEIGTITRYRISPPSFSNWHGFHLSVENFAFQDFPIILATMDLSVAENDR
jgi:Ni,Fe-hydrogenase III large subunit/NADH:ubiquinone oxidoreductase subunit C